MNNSKEQAILQLRQCISDFFRRAEELSNMPGVAIYGDASDQQQFQTIQGLMQQSGVDIEKWQALDDDQLGVLEMIEEGADPVLAVEVAYRELKGELES